MWDKVIHIFIITIVMFMFKDKMYRIVKLLEYYYKIFLLYFFAILNTSILMPLFIWNGRNVKNFSLTAEISKYITKLLDVKWHIRNPEIVADYRGAVFVINHQSSLDVLGLCNLWYAWGKATCVVKKELFYLWPFGLGLYLMDAIFVDRGSRKDANKLLQERANAIIQKKIKILVFPEGTRNNDSTKLLPFKKGAFNIAVGAQVPIIPIVISRYYFLDTNERIFNSGNVVAQCLEPISTAGLTMDDIPDLINRVQSQMEKVYIELSKEVSTLPSDYTVGK